MPATEHRVSLPDRYRVRQRIASGGMATVWAADDLVLGRPVAIKVLAPQIAADEDAMVRFEREARAAARVSDHAHVATIYDIGEHEGNAFIVMELFPGGTVADRLRDGARIPHDVTLRWLEEAGAALDAAHAQGIVHRDVKPANLLLDDQDRLAVGDFGIARMATDVALTSTGQVLGTAAYLSPEQALGEPATPASDLYSLAVVAYELLAGQRPFRGEHAAAQARQHVEATPPHASAADPTLPAAVDAVLARGLAKEPSDRWPSATDFVVALRAAFDAPAVPLPEATAPTRPVEPRGAVAPSPLTPPRPAARRLPTHRPRFPTWAAAVVALAAAGVILAILLASSGGDGDRSAARSKTGGKTSAAKTKTAAAAPAGSSGAAPAGTSGAALDAQGSALLAKGDYQGAIATLQRAVEAGKQTDCANPPSSECLNNYAYPLFNLARAYRQAGRPADAIPLLQQRLKIADQQGVVRQELAAAQQALGGAPTGKGKAKGNGKAKKE
jgi:eukaryotic-like serine/threonine-protein kinase